MNNIATLHTYSFVELLVVYLFIYFGDDDGNDEECDGVRWSKLNMYHPLAPP
jgi:hypothetical protein